jgi:hypothetical protein
VIFRIQSRSRISCFAGVVKRAYVHRWKVNGDGNRGIELGPYEESLRKFLMGETPVFYGSLFLRM